MTIHRFKDRLFEKQIGMLERVHQAAITVAGAHNVDSALQTIVNLAREIASAEYAALGIPGRDGKPMERFIVSGLSDDAVSEMGHPPTGRGMLGNLLQGNSIRLTDVQHHPDYSGYPDSHVEIRSFLGVPVQSNGVSIANLYLANKIGVESFSELDQHLIEMLAAHAATVIQNLRYQEKAREVALFQEREEIVRELQDNVVQAMYGVGLLMDNLDMTDPEQAGELIHDLRMHLDNAIEQLRSHLLSLTPGITGSVPSSEPGTWPLK